jgi:hypothetical protein
MIETGRHATVAELAVAEKINPSYVSRMLRLTLLAPDMVEAILGGRQPKGVTLPGLLEPFPIVCSQQTGCPLQCPALLIGGPATRGSNCLGRSRRARLLINAKDRNGA